jgi:hypothetical protein
VPGDDGVSTCGVAKRSPFARKGFVLSQVPKSEPGAPGEKGQERIISSIGNPYVPCESGTQG